MTISPIRDSSGTIVGASKIARDITARKQADERLADQAEELSRQADELLRSREALEDQARMLKLVLDSMGEGLVAADLEGRFLIWNDSATKLIGRGPAGLPTDQWTPYYGCYLPDGVTPCPTDRLPLIQALRGESLQMELMIQSSGNRKQGASRIHGAAHEGQSGQAVRRRRGFPRHHSKASGRAENSQAQRGTRRAGGAAYRATRGRQPGIGGFYLLRVS